MPDISMCNGQDCPLKDSCFRHIATPSMFMQSYFAESPFNKEKNKCDYYWEVKSKEQLEADEKANDF